MTMDIAEHKMVGYATLCKWVFKKWNRPWVFVNSHPKYGYFMASILNWIQSLSDSYPIITRP